MKTEGKDLDECTFQPEIKPNEVDIGQFPNELNQKSINKYLERMMCARVNKQDYEKKQETTPGSGKVWKNEITVPKPPKITASVSQR